MSLELQQQTNFELVVAQEIRPIEEPEEEIYLLPGTGFNVRLQIGMLPENPSFKEVYLWLDKTKEDIKAFWQEYLKKLPILPIRVEIDDQEKKLVAPKYGNRSLVDVTSSEERNGSVKKSVIEIETFLVKAKPNSVAILTSPPGWSNLKDEDGMPIVHKDTQTYTFYKDSLGKIQAFTLVSDLSLEDNENLIYNFSGKEINGNLPNREKIIDIVSSPLLLESKDPYSFNLEGVLRTIYALNPNSFNFDRALNLINHLDNLEGVIASPHVNKLIANFENSLIELFNESKPTEFHDKAAKLLGLTVLEISRATRILEENQSGPKEDYVPVYYNSNNFHSPQIDYQKELRFLQSKGGCNGGGTKLGTSSLETPFGSRSVTIGEPGPTCYCETCKTNVETRVADGIIYCSLCGERLGEIEKEENKD